MVDARRCQTVTDLWAHFLGMQAEAAQAGRAEALAAAEAAGREAAGVREAAERDAAVHEALAQDAAAKAARLARLEGDHLHTPFHRLGSSGRQFLMFPASSSHLLVEVIKVSPCCAGRLLSEMTAGACFTGWGGSGSMRLGDLPSKWVSGLQSKVGLA